MGIRILRPAALLAATLLLAGCVPGQAGITPAPEPSSTPIFATDAEALAAATDAYAKYLAVSDGITAHGGIGIESVSELVTPEQYKKEVSAVQGFADKGVRTQGLSVSDVIRLQSYNMGNGGNSSIVIYVCIDVSGVAILNSANQDVTPVGRQNRYPLEVEFEVSPKNPVQLKISRSDSWSGSNFCQ